MVKIIRENETSLVSLVKELVKESFGQNVKPNIMIASVPGIGSACVESEKLNAIAKGRFFNTCWKLYGVFNNNDGSELTVRSKYESQALNYAELYQQKTGKEVTVTIKD